MRRLTRRSGLLGRRRRSRWGAARPPSRTLLPLVREFLLPLQVFVETHGQILDNHILHPEAPLELSDKVVVCGANLLIHIDTFAVLGHAIREFARAPMLGLFNLAGLLLASVFDAGEDLLDFVFRRGGPDDEDQIIQTFFHDDDLFPSLRARGPENSRWLSNQRSTNRHYMASSSGLRR